MELAAARQADSTEDRRHYRLHGITIRITGPQDITQLIHERLARFHAAEARETGFDFIFTRGSVSDSHSYGSSRRIYDLDDGQVTYDPTSGVMFARYRKLVEMACYTISGRVIYALDPDHRAGRLASNILFTLPLIELMRRRDLFNIHAAGVSCGDKTILLAGASGAGKSTLALALTQAGWDYLGDDMVFLRADGRSLLGFPEGISYTGNTLRLLPGLPDPPQGRFKSRLWPDTVFGAREVLAAQAGALVFPRIAHRGASVLSPIDSSEAFLELASNVLMSDQRVCEAHFGALARLTQQVPSFRLQTGSDLARAADAISVLLRSSA